MPSFFYRSFSFNFLFFPPPWWFLLPSFLLFWFSICLLGLTLGTRGHLTHDLNPSRLKRLLKIDLYQLNLLILLKTYVFLLLSYELLGYKLLGMISVLGQSIIKIIHPQSHHSITPSVPA